jgi:hypothetical protein
MKLYYFCPNDYGMEFFTVASSEEEAIQSLNKYLEETDYPRDGWSKEAPPLYWGYEYFKNYTIEVYSPGEVVMTEIS